MNINLRTYLSGLLEAYLNNRPLPALTGWQKYFLRVSEAHVSCTQNRGLCNRLACLRNLTKLYAGFVDGDDAYGIANLHQLEVLEISFQHNPDAGLSYVAKTSLARLSIESDDRVTDRGLRQLSGLKTLRHLSIYPSAITDVGLAAVKNLRLTVLYLDDSLISDAGLQLLRRMPLARLSVTNTQVTQAAVRELRKQNPAIYISGL